MINAEAFLEPARARGFDFFTGVPCSFLTPVINQVITDSRYRYVSAASEGEAVAIAAGAWLAGRKTVVMCQNSGLGNTINPLTSLNWPFRIPTLLIVTWRGQPGLKDEPQHELMGEVTAALLDSVRVAHAMFPVSQGEVDKALTAAEQHMSHEGLPFALVMQKGSVQEADLLQTQARRPVQHGAQDYSTGRTRPSRIELLERLLALVPDDAAIVATTGKTGRELFTLNDRPQQFYLVGSMGCASALGLGVALNVSRPVVVIDGDGAALMKMGALATIGACAPKNLVHVVLDNGVHDSTGGQATVSASVSFADVAIACNYAGASTCDDIEGFDRALAAALDGAKPCLVHVRMKPGSLDPLGRPTITPRDVAQRFREFLARP